MEDKIIIMYSCKEIKMAYATFFNNLMVAVVFVYLTKCCIQIKLFTNYFDYKLIGNKFMYNACVL